MNVRIFETQLAPTLSLGHVVIPDNVAFHKSPKAEELVKARGAWLLFLPACSPDFNPIEMVFSKLKTRLRKRAVRSFDAITQALRDIGNLYPRRKKARQSSINAAHRITPEPITKQH